MFFRERRWWLNHAAVENNKSTFDTIRMTKLVTEPAAPHVGASVRPNNRGDLSPSLGLETAGFDPGYKSLVEQKFERRVMFK